MREQSDLNISWQLVTDDDGVRRAADLLAQSDGPVGVDAERASGYRYGQDAYLVQAFRRGGPALLFDPVGISDFSPLSDALGDQEWIFHAASQDIPCLEDLGLTPPRIFDTELAARLLGFERVGLGAVVEQLLGIHLEKAHSAADWSTRPLPVPWLEYAALDVTLLPDLRDAVLAELVAQNKVEIAEQEFAAAKDRRPKPPISEPWRKLSGGHRLRQPRQLALARELWFARDAFAREVDTAPGRLLPDSSIVAAAATNPRSKDELARMRDFTGRASRPQLDRWWRAIRAGKLTDDLPGPKPRDPNSIPNHRGWPQRHPEAAERLALARAVLEAEAENLGMPAENLLTPEVLRRIAWTPPQPASPESIALKLKELGARDWQIAVTSPIISASFAAAS